MQRYLSLFVVPAGVIEHGNSIRNSASLLYSTLISSIFYGFKSFLLQLGFTRLNYLYGKQLQLVLQRQFTNNLHSPSPLSALHLKLCYAKHLAKQKWILLIGKFSTSYLSSKFNYPQIYKLCVV